MPGFAIIAGQKAGVRLGISRNIVVAPGRALRVSGLVLQPLVSPRLGIVEPGVGEFVRQTAFSLLDVVDEATKVGAAATTGGCAADSGKDQLLAAIALDGDVRRIPLVDLAERDFAGLVVRFDALYDLRHRVLPLPAARRILRRLTKDSVVSLILQSLYHTLGAFPLRPD